MAFGSFDSCRSDTPIAEINMVPLIDVMLVLLVIFILTAPLMTHAVKVQLPKVSTAVNTPEPASVEVSVDAQGVVFWDGVEVPASGLSARMTEAAARTPQPALQLRADRGVRYEVLADVMGEAARAGLTRIGFVTVPDTPARP